MSEAKIEQLKVPSRNVYQMISEVMGRLASVGMAKSGKNTFDGYSFRGIDDVYNIVGPILAEVGLVIIPNVLKRKQQVRETKDGRPMSYVVLTVEYTLVSSEDGSQATVVIPGEAFDRSDKATNKALSAAFKYMIFQVLCPPVDAASVDDADRETPDLPPNSTGRRPESVSATVSRETSTPELEGQADEYESAIKDAVGTDDPYAFLELRDEMTNDLYAVVYGRFPRNVRKRLDEWEKARA